jgi:hypothetical protein
MEFLLCFAATADIISTNILTIIVTTRNYTVGGMCLNATPRYVSTVLVRKYCHHGLPVLLFGYINYNFANTSTFTIYNLRIYNSSHKT